MKLKRSWKRFHFTFPNASKNARTSSSVVDADNPPTKIFFVLVTSCRHKTKPLAHTWVLEVQNSHVAVRHFMVRGWRLRLRASNQSWNPKRGMTKFEWNQSVSNLFLTFYFSCMRTFFERKGRTARFEPATAVPNKKSFLFLFPFHPLLRLSSFFLLQYHMKTVHYRSSWQVMLYNTIAVLSMSDKYV